MKIVAPIGKFDEVAPLAEAGADEFYCGIVPENWIRRFGGTGVNRRIFCNLSNYEELAGAIHVAHRYARQISLVMNAQHYSEEQLRALLDMAWRFAGLGGDALIIGDVGLLLLLATEGPPVRLHVSSLLTCRNTEAAAMYRDMGAKRVILPRDMTLTEIATVAAGCSGMEFEAFIVNDGCVYEEGSCHTIHLPNRLGGPICLDRYEVAHSRADGAALNESESRRFANHDSRYRDWLWQRFGRAPTAPRESYPQGPCGVCAMPWLANHGLTAVKIVGREASLIRKTKSVEFVRRVRDRICAGDPAADVIGFAKQLRGPGPACDGGMGCYYRDLPAPTPAPARDNRSPG